MSCCILHFNFYCVFVAESSAAFYDLSTLGQFLTPYCLLVVVTVTTTVFYSLSSVCQYFTLYLLFFCHYARLYFLQCVRCLFVPHIVPSGRLCHSVQWCFLLSLLCLLVDHSVPSYGSELLCPLFSSAVSPMSYSTSYCTFCWFCLFCVTMSTAVFYILSTVCQYLNLYRLFSVLLCPLLTSTFCPLSVRKWHRTVCCLCFTVSTSVLYSLSIFWQCLTFYSVLVLSIWLQLSTVSPLSLGTLHRDIIGSVSL